MSTSVMDKVEATLSSEIKELKGNAASVSYEPKAWTREGVTD